ncbi:RNA polymerase sigma factor [Bacillaceae bacterium W0354]
MNSNKKTLSNSGIDYTIEELFEAYKIPIYQFIYRYCQDEQLSIDIVQDTFIRYQKYEMKFDQSKSSIKTYLFRMAYQILINRLKRRSRMKKLLPFLYQDSTQEKLPLEDKLSVREAIKELSDEQRAVIILTYYQDLTQKEIADILEIPLGTVKSRLHASLKILKKKLEVKE